MGNEVRYFRISPRFWARAEQRGWGDDTKLLALYLLTGPHRTTEGLYRLPKRYAQADLEWSGEQFDEQLRELIQAGFCDYDEQAQVVLVKGALRYQACPNENVAKAAVRRLNELPQTRLMADLWALAEAHDPHLARQLAKQFGEQFPEQSGDSPAPAPALTPSPTPAPTPAPAPARGAREDGAAAEAAPRTSDGFEGSEKPERVQGQAEHRRDRPADAAENGRVQGTRDGKELSEALERWQSRGQSA